MTVSQYDHVVPYTDLGGRGYFGVHAALIEDRNRKYKDYVYRKMLVQEYLKK